MDGSSAILGPSSNSGDAHRRGVTLIELVVVIGVLAILLAILLPAIRYARTIAADTVCTSRIRDLAMASMMFRLDTGQYPSPCRYAVFGDDRAVAVPHNVNTRLINDVAKYLKFPQIQPNTPAMNLPRHVQAPWAERTRNGRGPKPAKKLVDPEDDDYYYTGYIYTADLNLAFVGTQLTSFEGSGTLGLLKPERIASSRRIARSVIWADDLHRDLLNGYWRFGHGHNGRGGLEPFTYRDPRSLRGQHCGYSDGSVEWISNSQLKLDVAPEQLESSATYSLTDTLWWF